MTARAFNINAPSPALATLATSTIRMLAAEAIEKAKSGHPGAPMGMADLAFVLWTRYLRFNPADPAWIDRDRVVISNGHASTLLYSMLHLCGYDVTQEDLRQFRQWGSRTAGHPEYGLLPGVEVTTGPLGQGFSNAVGMAVALSNLAARVNSSAWKPVNARVFAFAGDGCVMEGIVNEAASLAGHLGLGNLKVIYDDNGITIDGSTDLAFSDDTEGRFKALGWAVLRCDGHDHAAIARAYDQALEIEDRPCLIMARTTIGCGSPGKCGKASVHGSPLGGEELARTREALGWTFPPFHVPEEVYDYFRQCVTPRLEDYSAWKAAAGREEAAGSSACAEWKRLCSHDIAPELKQKLLAAATGSKATRKHSAAVLKVLAAELPWLMGGSADLTPSNGTELPGVGVFSASAKAGFARHTGRYLHFGIREHAMAAVVNGITLSGTHRAFGATFLVFADYMRPSLRLAAMMELPSIFIFSHDSFMVGEDGPTHQPVEHLASLRLIPGMTVLRPADGAETALAWYYALARARGPVAIALTRQDLPEVKRPASWTPEDVLCGGYTVIEDPAAELTIAGSGSELHLCLEARELLLQRGLRARVVSMPGLDLFLRQSASYRNSVIPEGGALVTVEAGTTGCWRGLASSRLLCLGLDHFGASAPAEVLAEKFGFTGTAISEKIFSWMRE